ncbi:hypothetical protein GCM10025867_15180 [Frondihabitans sucicola]|uniref:LysR substrate-binding domain-containing protein n=1 Tax=Frondihabitans sucicola TaxID=1268041 RepID=A0ABM8GM51_9MICO|nr:hypothetical protein GCM10025867_15180 [Frondihabitans sucicola]
MIVPIDAQDPSARLRDDTADVVFARLPIETEGLHAIPLYEEQPVVVLPKEHALADEADVALADLAGETRLDLDDSLALEAAVEVVEAGAGVAVMPQSLARLFARKGVVARSVTDLPTTTIALVWPADGTTDDVSDFIGVVRGRTANSSRTRSAEEARAAAAADAKSARAARAKAKKAAKNARENPEKGGGKSASRPQARGPQRGKGAAAHRGAAAADRAIRQNGLMTQSSAPVALLTGVGRRENIAAATALTLARDGWDVALVTWAAYDRTMSWGDRPDDVASLAAEIEALGRRADVFVADLADASAASSLVGEVASAMGPVSGLVLSHSQSVDSSILDTTVESFDRHFAVNVRAAWLLIKAFAEQVPDGGGRIVALTSDHVVHNLPYGASKGALDRIVIAAARELGHLRITSNALNPGPVDTGWMDDATRETLTALQPSGALGLPQDAANIVRFLLSAEGGWISGQLIKSDGGFSV